MLRKDEKKALTRLAVLSLGWGLGLDRFYEGKTKEAFVPLIGWALVFGSLMFLAPCHSHSYVDGVKDFTEQTALNPLIFAPLAFGVYGLTLVIRKGFRLLRQFENSED